ncbi:MAG: hypothetical protein AB7G28_04650 [Pirellulales bacterium]
MNMRTLTVAIGCGTIGSMVGYVVASWQAEQTATERLYENYTSRAEICLEAAAQLRNDQVESARRYLETTALYALRGVPMGRAYSDLSPHSQELMVTALRYDAAFDDVDFGLGKLTRNDVPSNHQKLSTAIRVATQHAEL